MQSTDPEELKSSKKTNFISKTAVQNQLNKICKELVEDDGKFGEGKKFVHFHIEDKEGQDQFAAAAIFGEIRYEDTQTSTAHSVPVVIKSEPPDQDTRDFFYSNFQFSNEILFYSRLLPFLQTFQVGKPRQYLSPLGKPSSNSVISSPVPAASLAHFDAPNYPFAKFLKGGQNDPVLRSYAIVENASPQGFQLSESRQLLDIDHFLLLMDRLGRFHALSYIAKYVYPSKLSELTAKILETSWTDERLEKGCDNNLFIRESVKRSINKFDKSAKNSNSVDQTKQTSSTDEISDVNKGGKIENPDDCESFEKYQKQVARVKRLLVDDGTQVRFMRDITRGEEPMAVLCHGDFCRNNILFQYSNNSTSPSDVLFFDMATIRYSSPVIDLSFCMYLNSDAELRSRHWDDIVKSYHEGLRETVEAFAKANEVSVTEGKVNYSPSSRSLFLPSLADIHSEFHLYALYGFVHCSFFLPSMLVSMTSFDDLVPDGLDFWNLPLEEKLAIQNMTGGDEGTRMLNDIAAHLFDMGFV